MIVGIDEVGRGAWAGPLVVAAVGLGGITIDGLTDSKLLSKKKRETLSLKVKQSAPLVGIGWVSAADLDKIGLSQALKLATRRAFHQISWGDIDQIIIDGTIALISDPRVTLMKKADLLVPSVSAASIVAKVARDSYMAACDTVFPGYGFSGHVGYGAATHKSAIDTLGVLPVHRASFAPVALALQQNNNNYHMQKNVVKQPVQELRSGAKAESIAASALNAKGYEIVDQNWRTKWCEVDIIARRGQIIYFVEVKYRRSADQGGGIAAITKQKHKQLIFASDLWMNRYGTHDARISVIELSGPDFEITQWIESVE